MGAGIEADIGIETFSSTQQEDLNVRRSQRLLAHVIMPEGLIPIFGNGR